MLSFSSFQHIINAITILVALWPSVRNVPKIKLYERRYIDNIVLIKAFKVINAGDNNVLIAGKKNYSNHLTRGIGL